MAKKKEQTNEIKEEELKEASKASELEKTLALEIGRAHV